MVTLFRCAYNISATHIACPFVTYTSANSHTPANNHTSANNHTPTHTHTHREQLDEARRRYSKQQEAARKAAAAAVAAKQANWLQGALGSLFGVADVMRGNMGYGDARVGRRKRTGPVRYDPNRGTIPKERALVPVSVTARQHDYLEY